MPSEPKRKKRRRIVNLTQPNQPQQADSAPGPPSPPPQVDHDHQDGCPHCFLTPCVTVRGHYWLGEHQTAHPENHGMRKIKYKSYWKTMNNLGAWLDQRYKQRKVAAGGGAHDKRELMPICIVNQLRHLSVDIRLCVTLCCIQIKSRTEICVLFSLFM